MISRRIVLLALVLSAIFLPWWFVVPLVIGAFLFYRDFFEGVLVLSYFDLVYGADLGDWRGYFLFTLSGLLTLMIVEMCREALLMRN